MSTSFETTVSADALRIIVSDMFKQAYGSRADLDGAVTLGRVVFDKGDILAQRVTFGRISEGDRHDITDALLSDGGQVFIARKNTLGRIL